MTLSLSLSLSLAGCLRVPTPKQQYYLHPPTTHMKKAPAFFLLPFVCGISDQWIAVQRQPLNTHTQGRHLIIISPPANFLQPSYSGLPPPTAYLPASYQGSILACSMRGRRGENSLPQRRTTQYGDSGWKLFLALRPGFWYLLGR
jgi:hypothetical protein